MSNKIKFENNYTPLTFIEHIKFTCHYLSGRTSFRVYVGFMLAALGLYLGGVISFDTFDMAFGVPFFLVMFSYANVSGVLEGYEEAALRFNADLEKTIALVNEMAEEEDADT